MSASDCAGLRPHAVREVDRSRHGVRAAEHRAVRPGDELEVEAEILEVRPSDSRPRHGFVKFRTTTLNQREQPVQVLVMNLLVERRGADPRGQP